MRKIALVMRSRMLIAAAILGSFSCAATGEEISKYVAERFLQNPLITPSMMGGAGDNINGPSVIKAPDWLKNKLGKYYMYFAHPRG
jgi:hypothetical protein